MAKRLKTLNLCDASVERMKRHIGGQSAFARLAILDYDRNKHQKWEIQKELNNEKLLKEVAQENYNVLLMLMIEAYRNKWTVEGMILELMQKEQSEIAQIDQDGYLREDLRAAIGQHPMRGSD